MLALDRPVVFYFNAELIFDGRSSDNYLTAIWTTRNSVPDGILDNRLQQKPGNLRLVRFRTHIERNSKSRSKTNLFNGKILLGNSELFPQSHNMRFRKTQGVSQQTAKPCNHLGCLFGLLADDESGDGIERVKQEMWLQLVTERL